MPLPQLVVRLHERRTLGDAGVVDEDVAAAPEAFVNQRERARHVPCVRHVARRVQRLDAARALDLLCDARHLILCARNYSDARTFTRERQRDGTTDTAPAAG